MRLEPADDRTTHARIRDAAIALFADDGVAATSIRAIAAAAGVSPALVIHHFGSKDDLRHACDEHIAAVIRQRKHEAMSAGPTFDPVAALRASGDDPPISRYLARTLVDGSPHVAAIVDEMVADAEKYMAEGVASGSLRPSAYPRERATVLTLWSLGALVLHEHMERLAGVDLTADPTEMAGSRDGVAYVGAVLEMLTDGVVSGAMAERLRAAFPPPADAADAAPSVQPADAADPATSAASPDAADPAASRPGRETGS